MKIALVLAIALAAAIPAQDQKAAKAPVAKTPPPKVSLPPAKVRAPVNDLLNQCRAACARSRMLCLNQNEIETCDPSWTQCRADCARKNPN